MRSPVVTIDGPAGAGKSTVSKRLAARLGYRLLDTGALYRTVALVANERGIDLADASACAGVAAALEIDFALEGEINHVRAFGRDVTARIRAPEISQASSQVSALPEVRAALLGLQRRVGAAGGVVVEGRDVGTVVFPDAEVKFFLTASPEVRARRRTEELRCGGHAADEVATLAEMNERDLRDQNRSAAPLRQAPDAVLVDSSGLTIDEVLSWMERVVRSHAAWQGRGQAGAPPVLGG